MRSWDTRPAWTIGPKGEIRTLSPRVPLVLKVKQDTWRAYAFGPKWEARTICLRVPLVQKVNIGYLDCMRYRSYFQEITYMGWVKLSSFVMPKRHETAFAIGPKGEARTLGGVCHRSQRLS